MTQQWLASSNFHCSSFCIQKEINVRKWKGKVKSTLFISASCFKKFFQSILEDNWDKVHGFTDHTPDKKKYIEATISFYQLEQQGDFGV